MFLPFVLGSDFIKTSTGKETVNATFPVAIVMLRAIRDFFWKTGNKVYYSSTSFSGVKIMLFIIQVTASITVFICRRCE